MTVSWWWGVDALTSRETRQGGFVVRPRVDVRRYGTGNRDLGDGAAGPIEQLPDALVAVQRGELAEQRAGERERVAAAVGVAADGELCVAAPGQQRADRRRRDARLVAEQQTPGRRRRSPAATLRSRTSSR